MKYSFCNLIIEIENIPVLKLENYNLFRTESSDPADIFVQTTAVDQISLPDLQPVHEEPCVKIYRNDGGEVLRYNTDFWGNPLGLSVSTGRETTYCYLRDNYPRNNHSRDNGQRVLTELDLINGIGFEQLLAEKGRFILHSSFIRTKYGAVLFTAPSGTGKSTQAELWRKYRGAEILNGDRTGIWKENGRFLAGGVIWCGTSGIMENEILPVAAIVVLKQGPVNRISPLRMISKVGRMMEQTTINAWNREMYLKAQEFWMDLCSQVPVLELTCRPDEGAVQVLEEELEKYE
ncbi:MAG: hypothetical protein Q4B85_13140 [Lachnospiraceae bacterium]|nr:hypothetical protein [Lachnospiraceae bacterium]